VAHGARGSSERGRPAPAAGIRGRAPRAGHPPADPVNHPPVAARTEALAAVVPDVGSGDIAGDRLLQPPESLAVAHAALLAFAGVAPVA
jgi:hypothetical protein